MREGMYNKHTYAALQRVKKLFDKNRNEKMNLDQLKNLQTNQDILAKKLYTL